MGRQTTPERLFYDFCLEDHVPVGHLLRQDIKRIAKYQPLSYSLPLQATPVWTFVGGRHMSITLAELVVWVIVGVLAGSLAGTVVTGKWAGLGRWTGLGVGLVGALIGGLIFSLFGIWPGLDAIAISLRDIIAAFIGSLIFLLLLWIFRASRSGPS